MKMKSFYFPAVFLLLWLLSGCGYSSPYKTQPKFVGETDGVMTLYLSMWKNQTNELGFQSMIYQDLIEWLKKSKMVRLTQDQQEAKYILDGTINSIRFEGLSYGRYEAAIEIRAITKISYALREKETDKILWQRTNYVRRDNFRVSNNSVSTSDNKRIALAEISEDVAEEIYTKIFFTIARADKSN